MTIALLSALRDFFAACDAHSLRHAWENMQRSLPEQFVNLSEDIDWKVVEYAFNYLFVGPTAVPAPPYASIWLAKQRHGLADGWIESSKPVRNRGALLMTEDTMDVRELYRKLGYAVPEQGCLPDDHLAYELDGLIKAVSAMPLGLVPASSRRRNKLLPEILAVDLARRLSKWIPAFCARALAEPGLPHPIVQALTMLGQIIPVVAEALSGFVYENRQNIDHLASESGRFYRRAADVRSSLPNRKEPENKDSH